MSIAQLVAQRNVVQGYAANHLVKLLAPPIIRLHGCVHAECPAPLNLRVFSGAGSDTHRLHIGLCLHADICHSRHLVPELVGRWPLWSG